jgi:hypothetical protein
MIKLGSTVHSDPANWPYEDQDCDATGARVDGVVIKVFRPDPEDPPSHAWVRVAWSSGKADSYQLRNLLEGPIPAYAKGSIKLVKEFEEV